MKVLPDASIIDGVLDVCIVEALSTGAFLRAFPKVYTGSHAAHPKVQHDDRTLDTDRGQPGDAGLRRRGTGRPAAGVVRGGARRPVRGGGARRERDPMSESADGVLLIHAFPLDARMWDGQRRCPRAIGGRRRRRRCPGSAAPTAWDASMAMGAAADRCLQAADARGHRARGRLRALDGWLRRVRAVAHGAPADRRAGARQHALGRRHAGGRARAARPGRSPGRRGERVPGGSSRRHCSADGPPRADGTRSRRRSPTSPRPSIAAAARGMAERMDSTPDLGAIDVPVLVITSRRRHAHPAGRSRPRWRDTSRDAQLVTIGGAGHLSNLEAPERSTRRCGASWSGSGASEVRASAAAGARRLAG